MTNPMQSSPAPNHHAHQAGFAGLTGVLGALTMTIGRAADAAVALDIARVQATDRVVDVGCGPGTAVRRAARVGAHLTGVDPAGVMLRAARLIGGDGHISYVEGGAEALPLPDTSATVVWSLSAVHHWPELDAGMAEVWRVLEPGGRFVVIEHRARPGAPGHASHGWTDEQAETFAETCRNAGFTAVTVSHPDGARRPPVAVAARKP